MDIIHIGLGVRGRHWLEIVRDDPRVISVGCVDPELSALGWVHRSCHTAVIKAVVQQEKRQR